MKGHCSVAQRSAQKGIQVENAILKVDEAYLVYAECIKAGGEIFVNDFDHRIGWVDAGAGSAVVFPGGEEEEDGQREDDHDDRPIQNWEL